MSANCFNISRTKLLINYILSNLTSNNILTTIQIVSLTIGSLENQIERDDNVPNKSRL